GDARAFLTEMNTEDITVEQERSEIAFLTELIAQHPDPFVRFAGVTERETLRTLFDESDAKALDGAGIIDQWQTVGAFDNDQGKGFLTEYPPENGIDLAAEMKGVVVPVHWRAVPALTRTRAVPLRDIMSPDKSVAYLASWLTAPSKAHAQLVLTTGDPFRVWLNGRLVGEEQKVDALATDGFAIPIDLQAGGNELLVKSANEGGAWTLRARVVDDKGDAIAGLMAQAKPVASAHDGRPAKATVAVLPAVQGDGARALLWRTRVDSHAGLVREALETARMYEKASKASPFAILLVSRLEKRNQEAGKAIDILNRAIGDNDKEPHAPAALIVDRARFYESKKRWDTAQDDLQSVLARDPNVRSASEVLAKVFEQRRWFVDESRVLDQALARWPTSAALLDDKSMCLTYRGLRDEKRALDERELALIPGSTRVVERLAFDAQLHDRYADAMRLYDRIALLEPWSSEADVERATIAHEMHDDAGARAFYDSAHARDPDNSTPLTHLGDLAYEGGDKAKALGLWREALARDPSDSDLSVHLDYVAGEGLGDLAKLVPAHGDIQKAIVAALGKAPAPGSNVINIIDHEVVEVNADGSSRAVITQVMQAVNQRGRDQLITSEVPRGETRILDAHSITPSGESQEASSIANGTIRFRNLDVGSITVVQYMTHRGSAGFLPNHYVATWWFSQIQHDVRDATWILVMPKDRKLVRDIQGDVKETVVDDGDKRIRTYRAVDVPPLIPEPNMPPANDLLRRVSVSTLDGWDEYVRWEQALLKDAFRSNPEVDALAAKLLAGASTPHDKIDRLFRYVSKDIRYTQEYETSIAGVKPHACPVVLERGYGDCKDKAVLLILLLRKAGIDADFAILRTTDAGKVEKDIPNQQFNHAIVYVRKQPGIEQGYFTDPTTDALDLGNLRSDDQGAVSLVLEPEGPTWHFEDIPYQSSEFERAHVDIKLDPATAKAHVDMSMRGAGASSGRRAVRDAETEKKLLQGWATYLFPGASLVDGKSDTSEDLAKPFTGAFNADVPGALHDDADGTRVDVPHISPFATLTQLAERKLPLRLGISDNESLDMVLAIPPGKKVLRTPADYHVVGTCFTADRTTTTGATDVHVIAGYVKTCPEISAADYPAFRAKALEVVAREHDPIVLTK
ncbi:MAG TPA: transglutaminase domain-containing protein, partial [Myxococcota bacterium]